MKALLLKDFLTLSKTIRYVVIFMLVMACIPQMNMSVFFMVYCTMLPVNALAYDERTKWDTLAAMMPYRTREIVLGKYVLGYIVLIALTALSMLALTVRGMVTGAPLDADQYLMLLIYAMATTVFLAITLPLVFQFGVEKGRIALFIGIGAAIGIFVTIIPLLSDQFHPLALTRGQLTVIVLTAAAVLNLISIQLSTCIYKRKHA